MQAAPIKPPIIFPLLISFSLLIGLFALISEWLEPKPQIQPFTLVLENPLQSMPDLSHISHIPDRKDSFFKTLLPLVLYENERIAWHRGQLKAAKTLLEQGKELSEKDLITITKTAHYYGLEWPLSEKEWATIDKRVYPVPVDLVLMQAANESAWGTSRFAQKGNNLFGQWCFTKGCGIVPAGRDSGKNHEVRKFTTVLASVQAYMRNINTHRAYRQLRSLRQELYQAGKEVGGVNLAPGLISYSERRQAYVDELIEMMNSNAKYLEHAMQELELPSVEK